MVSLQQFGNISIRFIFLSVVALFLAWVSSYLSVLHLPSTPPPLTLKLDQLTNVCCASESRFQLLVFALRQTGGSLLDEPPPRTFPVRRLCPEAMSNSPGRADPTVRFRFGFIVIVIAKSSPPTCVCLPQVAAPVRSALRHLQGAVAAPYPRQWADGSRGRAGVLQLCGLPHVAAAALPGGRLLKGHAVYLHLTRGWFSSWVTFFPTFWFSFLWSLCSLLWFQSAWPVGSHSSVWQRLWRGVQRSQVRPVSAAAGGAASQRALHSVLP